MKRTFLLLAVLFLVSKATLAQVPQAIPYQSAVRSANGQPLINTNVKIRFSIMDSIAIGTIVYQETHAVTTNSVGIVNLNVGQGSVVTGTFSSINWEQNFKFLKMELDPTGTGTSYTDMGTQQMLSVPYALVAGRVATTNNITTPSSSSNCYTCPSMFSTPSSTAMSTQYAAAIFCSQKTESGFSDWRLPSLIEFEYLRDVLNLTTPAFDCWTRDFDIETQNTIFWYGISTNRVIIAGNSLKSVCVR
jgi:hypothetical protein